ncbi:MAG: GIY-YIG nuclease family protein [Candidatus Omnitrophica bacterium]|nr:GIY-YIG nuclease family protein [Candidatus Omnitrophota bacterium]
MYYVYILENKQGWHYVGSTADVEFRLRRHNQNSVRSTKNKGPFRVVYKEEYGAKTAARKRENLIKQYKSVNTFLKLVTNNSTPSSSLV